MSLKFAVISSTGASVVRTVFNNTSRSEFNIDLVLADRPCGAIDFAKHNGITNHVVEGKDSGLISDAFTQYLQDYDIDYCYVFYTRLLRGSIINDFDRKLINFHPSLLPAHPGLSGFEDSIASKSLLIGTTVHFIDNGMDTGDQIMQTYLPVQHPVTDLGNIRHAIFAQQCASLLNIHQHIQKSPSLTNTLIDSTEAPQRMGFVPSISHAAHALYEKILYNEHIAP